jgi:hypothetical protein
MQLIASFLNASRGTTGNDLIGRAKVQVRVGDTREKRGKLTMLSRLSSMADMSLPICFRLSAITCSSSVCVDPMPSKLISFKLFASVLVCALEGKEVRGNWWEVTDCEGFWRLRNISEHLKGFEGKQMKE